MYQQDYNGPHNPYMNQQQGQQLQGMYPPMAQPQIVVKEVYVVEQQDHQRQPESIICPNCKQSVVTNVQYETGAGTWLCCILIFILFCPLFFLPICCDSCKNVIHTCPNCGANVGYNKFLC